MKTTSDLLPILSFHKDKALRYIACNEYYASLVGIDNIDDINSKLNKHLPITRLMSDRENKAFIREDMTVLSGKRMSILDVHNYFGEIKIFITQKTPYYNNKGNVAGIMCQGTQLLNPSLGEVNYFINNYNLKITQATVNNINDYFTNTNKRLVRLSTREAQSLYYLARGKSAVQIGEILGLSGRTVQFYLDRIKNKLNCSTKSDLIEISLDSGLAFVRYSGFLHGYLLHM